jgi:ssDNA-binding replication factor A large subunit
MKIAELKPGMKDVEIVAKVKTKQLVHSGPKKLAQAVIEDETGQVVLNLWRNQVDQVEVGDLIRIKNAYTKSRQGQLILSSWYDFEIADRPMRISKRGDSGVDK